MKKGIHFFGNVLLASFFFALGMLAREETLLAEHGPDAVPKEAFGTLLTMSQAIEKALASEPRLKQALARIAKERALHEESTREFFPKLKLEVKESIATGDETLLTNFRASLEEPIFQGGKLVHERKRRGLTLKREELTFEETKLNLIREIRVLYARVLAEKEFTRVAQEKVRELAGELERGKKLMAAKALTPSELIRAETRYEEGAHELVSHKETYDYLWGILAEIVGASNGEALELEALPELKELGGSETFYLERARENHPLYKAHELLIEEKRYETKELEAERFPHLALAAEWERARDVYLDTNRFLVGVKGTWNVWDFGRTSTLLKAKHKEMEEITWEIEARILEHEREIKKLLHDARTLHQGIKFSRARAREARELYKNEKARELAGERGDTVETFLTLADRELDLIQKVTEYRITLAELEWRMGVAP